MVSGTLCATCTVTGYPFFIKVCLVAVLNDAFQLVFEQKGVNLDSPTVAMCNAGMSACLLSLAAHELGYQMPIYDGSWSEILFKKQTEPS